MSEDPTTHEAERTIPLVEERLKVETVARTGTVRIATRTRAEEVAVEEELRSLRAEVERVPVDRFVDEVPEIERRGDVTVIPVVEEVLVKRILLREELHVRQVSELRTHAETVTLRRQEPVVERDGTPDADG